MHNIHHIGLSLALALALTLCVSVPTRAADAVDFERDVLPILKARCIDCHGAAKQKGGLRIDLRAALLRGGDHGEPAIRPGDADASLLVRTVTGRHPDLKMPPKGDRLTPQQVDAIRAWINAGAAMPESMHGDADPQLGPEHWAFRPIRKVDPPKTATAWGDNPIDAFVLAQLEASRLKPSPLADRRTLIRRLYLDMHGLPPTPQQVDAFVNDDAPGAWERLVEQVLASSRYGERYGQHWLDVVRYADTTGYEFNRMRPNAWPYRDYVIAAFNDDKPYDRFVTEQIAGDVLGVDPATGFLVTAPVPSPPEVGDEPDAIREARLNSLDEMMRNVGASMLGVTIGCARCHHHKFDPITMQDYYAMQAVFAGVEYDDRDWRQGDEALRREQVQQAKLERLEAVQRLRAFDVWREKDRERTTHHFPPVEARFVRLTIHGTNDKNLPPSFDEVEVWSTPGNDGQSRNLALAKRVAKVTTSGADEARKAIDERLNDGKLDARRPWFAADAPPDAWVRIELSEPVTIDRLAWNTPGSQADRTPTDFTIEVATEPDRWRTVVTRTRDEQLSMEDVDRRRKLEEQVAELNDKIPQLEKRPQVFAGDFKAPPVVHVLGRGDHKQPREIIAPDAIGVIGSIGLTTDAPEQVRRFALAKWIASDDNPLTARVIVNRIWMHHFGLGIVDTPSDFGAAGSRPTHPDLLDWLARWFINEGWSIKQLHRVILTSATYRQDSTPRPDAMKRDADTRLLWRYPPQRVEAEALRDSMLMVSGELDTKMGGPGYVIFDKIATFGEWVPLEKMPDGAARRMVYMMRPRAADDGMFAAFDLPDCGQVRPKRSVSTTPIQALNLFNGSFTMRRAERFAQRVATEAGDDTAAQARRAFEIAFGRPPSQSESTFAERVIASEGLPTLCRALFNANEFLFRP